MGRNAPKRSRPDDGANSIQLGESRISSQQKSQRAKLLLEQRPDWHAAVLSETPLPSSLKTLPTILLETIHDHAKHLLDDESKKYEATHLQTSSSYKFMSSIMTSGTWSDKVSALTLVVQESPLHTTKQFRSLLGLAAKNSRDQALMAVGALKDLLSRGVVLPADRKLRYFAKQPALLAAFENTSPNWTSAELLPSGLTERHLVYWAFEDWLKRSYFELLKTLERWCNDEVEWARLRAVTFVWELLKERPEQEENLLRLLVNKLGDMDRKVASKVSHLLLQLEEAHPHMKPVVISALESDVLLRPGQSLHAKYYAVITLNQTVLQIANPEVANQLLDVYFALFVSILNRSKGQKQNVPSKEMPNTKKRSRNSTVDVEKAEEELVEKNTAQILTGINRAFPFSKKDAVSFEQHTDTLFRITHSANFNTSIQALMLIQQICAAHLISSDRFLRTLYESLLDPRLIKSSKHTLYLNLLYRSLKSDVSIRRVKAFVKRLLQVITLHDPPFVTAVLYLIVELTHIFPGLNAMIEQPEATDDDEEIFKDVPDTITVNQDTKATDDNTVALEPTPFSYRLKPYDPRKRDPEHSNAERTCLWELSPWLTHYHPSVQVFASHLQSPTPSKPPPKPDPESHTLMHFLDRFAYRNPKQRPDAGVRGSSLMQPALASTGTADTFFHSGENRGRYSAPLNSETFWTKSVAEVAPDQVFFHRYFREMGPRVRGRKGKESQVQNADEDEFEEREENEIWKAIVGSRPEMEGGSDVEMEDEEVDEAFREAMDNEDEDSEGSDLDADQDDMVGDEDDISGDEGVELNLESDSDALFSSEEEAEEHVMQATVSSVDEKGEPGKKKRRKLKDLPTFASIDDYAELLSKDDEDEQM